MELYYSFIIPVYNRPDELNELLESLAVQTYDKDFEVVVVEDGSSISSEEIIRGYNNKLSITYYFKENSGPGDSRNYGMQRARGNYFLILDSDCILPEEYLSEVDKALQSSYVDCFGGPDAAHQSFTDLQKAINYCMTSFLTTGGIRGKKAAVSKFQPRSFNMGISKNAFLKTHGFGKIHPGEDPDLTIRIWNEGFETRLIEKAFVYHKRRISWEKFHLQVHKFGLTRPILNKWHPETAKITYWFPALFIIGLVMSVFFYAVGLRWLGVMYLLYFLAICVHSTYLNKSLKVGILTLPALLIQFYGYGSGFLKSTVLIGVLNRDPEEVFPNLFFK